MAKLLIKSGGQPTEINLKPGSNRIGRSVECDFQITDGSVSGNHCDIILANGTIFIRDLGSTNGTFIERQKIGEAYLQPGQTLHLGNVEIACLADEPISAPAKSGLRVMKSESAATVETPASTLAKPALRVAAVEAPTAPPPPPQGSDNPHLSRYLAQQREKMALAQLTFFQRLPDAFKYPFRRNGIILLVTGTVLFVVLDFLGSFSARIAVLAFGYLFAYMQKIITYSATGEEDMPAWPEVSNWWEDILHPALMLFGCFIISFGPALGFWIFVEMDPSLKTAVGLGLALFGCFYLPMALLATAMYDSLFALNPLLIVPSMLKIPREYLVACLLLGALVGFRILSTFVLALIPIPIVPTVITGFVSLYLVTLEVRILGVMYHTKQNTLNWSF